MQACGCGLHAFMARTSVAAALPFATLCCSRFSCCTRCLSAS